MLQLLADYAKQKGLVAEPGFAPREVRWNLVFSAGGDFQGAVEIGDLSGARNRGLAFPCCPHLSHPEIKRGGAGTRHFLVDSADVISLLGTSPDPADPEAAKLRAKHTFFVDLLRQAAPHVPGLAGPAAALADPEVCARIAADLARQKAKPTDRVTLSSADRKPPFFVEGDDWHSWWRSFRLTLARGEPEPGAAAGRLAPCLVSGESIAPVPTHPKISGLTDVGGLAMGDVLVSFKQESFQSYGLEQSANAPVSEESAAAYSAALNYLVRHQSVRLAHLRVVYWYKDSLPADSADPLAFLADPQLDEAGALARAEALLESYRTGRLVGLADNRYYALTLSGAAGRVMVRDWQEGELTGLARAVAAWFDDLAIVRRDGRSHAPPPKFLAVLGPLARTLDDVPPPLTVALWRAALRPATGIPRQALARALARFRQAVLAAEPIPHACAGLLRAFGVRAAQPSQHGDPTMATAIELDATHPHPAYQCGRLLALLAAVQYGALGDVGAGVVQRYYAAASATPALVIGRLVRTAQFHLGKMDRGLAHWHETRLAGTLSHLQPDNLPRTLTLEQQSLFALGYYHQVAADRARAQGGADAVTADLPSNAAADPSQETPDHG